MQFAPQSFECLDVLKGDEESMACLKVSLVAPFQRQMLFCVVFFFNFLFSSW